MLKNRSLHSILCKMKSLLLLLVLVSSVNSQGAAVKDITAQINLVREGVIAGYGDFNSDKATDLFTISHHTELFVHFWDVTKQTFKQAQNLKLDISSQRRILNIALNDFNGDGSMDVLVTTRLAKGDPSEGVMVEVYYGDKRTVTKGADSLHMIDQPTLIDVNGDLLPDLFGTNSETNKRSYWISEKTDSGKWKHSFRNETQNLVTSTVYVPTSNAFVDCTGDMHPDLFLMSQNLEFDADSVIFETWEQKGANLSHLSAKTFTFNITEKAHHYGQMSFADIDSDGVTDVILPVCLSKDCSNSAIYARSLSDKGQWVTLLDNSINADFAWRFPLKNMDKTKRSMFPFTLRFNDLTMDGNVDAVAILENAAQAPGSSQGKLVPVYLVNVKCYAEKASGCFNGRTLKVTPIDGIENPVLIRYR